MSTRGRRLGAREPFRPHVGNPRPWLVVSGPSLPYPDEESIAVACTTQTHHDWSVPVSDTSWRVGQPDTTSHVLPWTVATVKDRRHVVGRQGQVTDEFVERIVDALVSYLAGPDGRDRPA